MPARMATTPILTGEDAQRFQEWLDSSASAEQDRLTDSSFGFQESSVDKKEDER